jgi:hypothetical protein
MAATTTVIPTVNIGDFQAADQAVTQARPSDVMSEGDFQSADRLATQAETARQPAGAASTPATTAAPAKADAAPKGGATASYVGLCDAMNSYEKSLVKAGVVEFANQYEIQFVPANKLASAKVAPKGPTELAAKSMAKPDTAAAKVDSSKTTVDMASQRFSLVAGAQIIQFISMVLQNSTYITDQLKAVQDPTKADKAATPQSATTKTTDWFRISVSAVPIGTTKDKKRNDYPYKITYLVTTYAINQMQSQYFNDAKFRGIHKSYDYWFTGKNTQVLRYEQSYNTQFFYVMGSRSKLQGPQNSTQTDDVGAIIANGPGKPANVPSQTTTTLQGSTNDANTPTATAADYLYSMADQGTVKIQIVGDPAWLLQGEVKGITANSVNFNGFYPDGSVCYETQEVVFAINFNAPADYNNAPGSGGPAGGTGLMDTVSRSSPINSASGSTQASAAYRATTIKSTFSKGSFTQELEGTALTNLNAKQIADASNGRSVKGSAGGNGTVRSDPNGTAQSPSAPALASAASPNAVADQVNNYEDGLPKEPSSAQPNDVSNPPNMPTNPPGPVTSNGDDVTNRDPIVTNTTPGVGRPTSAEENNRLFLGTPTTASTPNAEFITAAEVRDRRLTRQAAEDAQAPQAASRPVMAPRDDSSSRLAG